MVIEEYQQAKYLYLFCIYFDTILDNFIRLLYNFNGLIYLYVRIGL